MTKPEIISIDRSVEDKLIPRQFQLINHMKRIKNAHDLNLLDKCFFRSLTDIKDVQHIVVNLEKRKIYAVFYRSVDALCHIDKLQEECKNNAHEGCICKNLSLHIMDGSKI